MSKAAGNNNSGETRQKISKSLQEKWQDPKFREKMMLAMRNRKTASAPVAASKAQRDKISAAMKKKWQDESYRQKTIKGMEKYRDSLPPKEVKPKVIRTVKTDEMTAVTPLTKRKSKTSKVKVRVSSATAGVTKTKKKKKATKTKVALAQTLKKTDNIPAPEKEKTKELNDDGDISRMREERRDLYDLLYGDEGESGGDGDDEEEEPSPTPGVLDLDLLQDDGEGPPSSNPNELFNGIADLDDDNLDDYDPYNLDDY